MVNLHRIPPIRYRGYYYDAETGFYYVSSRYYDPEVGRFINADDPEILFEDQDNILENNLYTYCFNNPVNNYDPSGYLAITITASTFYALHNVVLSIGVSVMISGQIYRVVTYKQSSRYKYSVQLEKQAKEKKKTKKKSKKTGKEKANDVPDWAKRQSYNPRKSAEQNATDVLNKKYGKGNWKKGPGSDFSKIKKWLQRSKGYK